MSQIELKMMVEQIRAIHEELARITKSISQIGKSHLESRAVSVREAAKMMSLGLTKTRELVRNGTLATVEVGSRFLVPIAEIERLLTPSPRPASKPRGKPSKRGATESPAELRAWAKKQRGQ